MLEDRFKQNIARTPLWSAIPIEENPGLIVDAHLAFLRAGAEIISTSTYVSKNKIYSGMKLLYLKLGCVCTGINVHEKRSNKPGTLPRRVSRSCRDR
jgi:hypothetical protein